MKMNNKRAKKTLWIIIGCILVITVRLFYVVNQQEKEIHALEKQVSQCVKTQAEDHEDVLVEPLISDSDDYSWCVERAKKEFTVEHDRSCKLLGMSNGCELFAVDNAFLYDSLLNKVFSCINISRE